MMKGFGFEVFHLIGFCQTQMMCAFFITTREESGNELDLTHANVAVLAQVVLSSCAHVAKLANATGN